jgi:predicted metallopeptidase
MSRALNRSGFDFTTAMRRLVADMIERLPELEHIDLDRVLISFTQTRKRVPHGIQATLTPMRFQGGNRTTRRRGNWYRIQACVDASGREMLYVLSFYLPRFLDRPLDDKLVTILHELWHISPRFDGDLRRHPGRCYAHSHSQAEYDREMAALSKRWLEANPSRELYSFLEGGFGELVQTHGRVFGMQVKRPRLVRVTDPDVSEREMEAVLQNRR